MSLLSSVDFNGLGLTVFELLNFRCIGFLILITTQTSASSLASHYILYQLPPGEKLPLRLGTSVGYQGIPLDPQGPKMVAALRISGPDQRGRLRQVPGGPEPGHHQGLISGQSSRNTSCWGWLSGLISGVSGHPGAFGTLETLAKRAARSAASKG